MHSITSSRDVDASTSAFNYRIIICRKGDQNLLNFSPDFCCPMHSGNQTLLMHATCGIIFPNINCRRFANAKMQETTGMSLAYQHVTTEPSRAWGMGHQANGAPWEGRVSGVGAIVLCTSSVFRIFFSRQIRRMETFVYIDTETNPACYLFSQ